MSIPNIDGKEAASRDAFEAGRSMTDHSEVAIESAVYATWARLRNRGLLSTDAANTGPAGRSGGVVEILREAFVAATPQPPTEPARAEDAQVEPLTIIYTNWRGETAERRIRPVRMWYGATDWHPEPQWLLKAIDVEKKAERDFAWSGIDFQGDGPARAEDAPHIEPGWERAAIIETALQAAADSRGGYMGPSTVRAVKAALGVALRSSRDAVLEEARETQASINEWIESAFGPAPSAVSIFARANQEMSEMGMALANDDADRHAVEEAADVVIILYRLAHKFGIDLGAEIDRKMAINSKSRWKVGNGHGYHIEDASGEASQS